MNVPSSTPRAHTPATPAREPRPWWQSHREYVAPGPGDKVFLWTKDLSISSASGQVQGPFDIGFRSKSITAVLHHDGTDVHSIMLALAGLENPVEGSVTTVKPRRGRIAGTVSLVTATAAPDPTLTVHQNLVSPLAQLGQMARADDFDDAVARCGLERHLDVSYKQIPTCGRLRVNIAAALLAGAQVIILEDPTHSLARSEDDDLLAMLRAVADADVAIIASTLDGALWRAVDRTVVLGPDGLLLDTVSPQPEVIRTLIPANNAFAPGGSGVQGMHSPDVVSPLADETSRPADTDTPAVSTTSSVSEPGPAPAQSENPRPSGAGAVFEPVTRVVPETSPIEPPAVVTSEPATSRSPAFVNGDLSLDSRHEDEAAPVTTDWIPAQEDLETARSEGRADTRPDWAEVFPTEKAPTPPPAHAATPEPQGEEAIPDPLERRMASVARVEERTPLIRAAGRTDLPEDSYAEHLAAHMVPESVSRVSHSVARDLSEVEAAAHTAHTSPPEPERAPTPAEQANGATREVDDSPVPPPATPVAPPLSSVGTPRTGPAPTPAQQSAASQSAARLAQPVVDEDYVASNAQWATLSPAGEPEAPPEASTAQPAPPVPSETSGPGTGSIRTIRPVTGSFPTSEGGARPETPATTPVSGVRTGAVPLTPAPETPVAAPSSSMGSPLATPRSGTPLQPATPPRGASRPLPGHGSLSGSSRIVVNPSAPLGSGRDPLREELTSTPIAEAPAHAGDQHSADKESAEVIDRAKQLLSRLPGSVFPGSDEGNSDHPLPQ